MNTLPADLVLLKGCHSSPDTGMCIMEAASYVAGEPWSDHPQCVSPVIGVFLRQWNDDLSDDKTRTRLLLPLLPQILGTRSTAEVEQARSYMALDWLCRECLPTWLEAVPTLAPLAQGLRNLDPLTGEDSVAKACDLLSAAGSAASSAARSALKSTVEKLQQSAVQLVLNMVGI